jgi:hypothetical protein
MPSGMEDPIMQGLGVYALLLLVLGIIALVRG